MLEIVDIIRRASDGVVINVFYKVTKIDGNHTAEHTGAVMIPPRFEDDKFVPFESLTADVVREWVQSMIGDEMVIIDELLKKKIQEQKEPNAVSGLPWSGVSS